ncbi:MAG TPA: hypothetical protein ENJ82_17760, partial [Bacteroidetes bacterium]|nr:hypothetical protein [Bacteroidota bacterium]
MSKTGFWRRIFGQSERPIPWDIRTVTAAELSEYPNGISDIQMQRFDGFLIKNVASAGEIKQLLDGLARVDEAKKHSPQAGMGTYPEPFFSVSIKMRKGEEVTEKVDKWVEFERDFPRNFGFDFFARLTDLLEKMSGGKQVKFPIGLNGISQMIPGNFRELAPGLGEIKVHSGNQFLDEFAD